MYLTGKAVPPPPSEVCVLSIGQTLIRSVQLIASEPFRFASCLLRVRSIAFAIDSVFLSAILSIRTEMGGVGGEGGGQFDWLFGVRNNEFFFIGFLEALFGTFCRNTYNYPVDRFLTFFWPFLGSGLQFRDSLRLIPGKARFWGVFLIGNPGGLLPYIY